MILFDNTLVSLDLFRQQFVCNLPKCLGKCCYEGNSGAPLEKDEIEVINRELTHLVPFMTGLGRELILTKGFHEVDPLGEPCTTCIDEKDCVFSYLEDSIYHCAIEKAYDAGEITFRKPISCHLYPVRLGKIKDLTTLNYDEWDICLQAKVLGRREGVPLFMFLKEALVRKFGLSWYVEMEKIYEELKKEGQLQ